MLEEQLNIAGGYKQLFEMGVLTEKDRMDLKLFAGWIETELNRAMIRAKTTMSEESQILMMP